MCTSDVLPAADALRTMEAAVDCLTDPAGVTLQDAALGEVLAELGTLSGKLAAARAAILARFEACRGYNSDGYGSAASWLAARNRETRKPAAAEVRRIRQHNPHPFIAAAHSRPDLSDSRAAHPANGTPQPPPYTRPDGAQLLA